MKKDERTLLDHELMGSWTLHDGAERGFWNPVLEISSMYTIHNIIIC